MKALIGAGFALGLGWSMGALLCECAAVVIRSVVTLVLDLLGVEKES